MEVNKVAVSIMVDMIVVDVVEVAVSIRVEKTVRKLGEVIVSIRVEKTVVEEMSVDTEVVVTGSSKGGRTHPMS